MYLCYLKSLRGVAAEKCSKEWLEGNEKTRPCEWKQEIPASCQHMTINELCELWPPPEWVGAGEGNGNAEV